MLSDAVEVGLRTGTERGEADMAEMVMEFFEMFTSMEACLAENAAGSESHDFVTQAGWNVGSCYISAVFLWHREKKKVPPDTCLQMLHHEHR